MADESHSFTTARARLDEIVAQVRKKDTSLEQSLDLLEEGVRLANACTELIDRADWAGAPAQTDEGGPEVEEGLPESDDAEAGETSDETRAVYDSEAPGEVEAAGAESSEEPLDPEDPAAPDR